MGLRRRLRVVGSNIEGVMMSDILHIAFATNDMRHVNQHFGAARCFAIYAVGETCARLIEAAQFSEHRQGHSEAKLQVKMDTLRRCAAVYCQAAGSSAVNRLLAAGIQPVKVDSDTPIKWLIADLQSQLNSSPPPWSLKTTRRGQAQGVNRFDKMEAEGWDE